MAMHVHVQLHMLPCMYIYIYLRRDTFHSVAVKFFQFPPRGGGVVVNVSSMSYRAPSKYLAVYAASKVLSVCLGPL